MEREELFSQIERMTVGPDDTFKFKCTMCGKCCVDREDILLNPMDIYRMSKHMGVPPVEFFGDFCETYVGESSHIPIVRLRPQGREKRCPLLKGKKCLVHEAKPSVCAMYPLGRYMKFDASDINSDAVSKAAVQYILQPIGCGKKTETHTVREWLSGFNMDTEDEAYIKWNKAISELGPRLKKMNAMFGAATMELVWRCALIALYLNYSIDEEFLPQFENNVTSLISRFSIIDAADPHGVPIP